MSTRWPSTRSPATRPSECDGVPGDQDWNEPCKDLSNDFLQYWLGSYSRADAGGVADDGSLLRFAGVGDPLAGFTGELDGADSAQNQADAAHLGTATHLITSSVLDPATHPDFASSPAASWEGAGQFTARTGSWFMHSQVADEALEAPDPDDRPHRPDHRRRSSSGRTGTPRRTGTGWSSRPTPSARTTGRRCRTSTATRRRGRARAARRATTTSPCTRSSPTTSRARAPARRRTRTSARRAGRAARGIRRTGPRPATSSGRSTSASSPASRSRSRSR